MAPARDLLDRHAESRGELVIGAVRQDVELTSRDERLAGIPFAAGGRVAPWVTAELADLDVAGTECEEAHKRLERVPVGQAVDVRARWTWSTSAIATARCW